MNFNKIAVSGTSSESGKTTLLCQLLGELQGWEAIKVTRGHYRSCGKDPHACCVSDLLSDQPVVRSGFQQTFADDKDTGRYWEAGAANVHWLIATDAQVEVGVHLALERVKAPGVLIEGNSFLQFHDVDFGILVAGSPAKRIKASTRWAYQKASALYTFEPDVRFDALAQLQARFPHINVELNSAYLPSDFDKLLWRVMHIPSTRKHVTWH
jgi:molybdopterin-guanine dinucleotide biosynthesis protein